MANASQPLRVLIVDDERVIADTLALIVQGRGHQTRVAYNATDAMAILRDFQPDLLITDVVMPEIDGITLADHFSEHCPECKVILISGNQASRRLLQRAAQRGHNYRFLQKPFHPRELLDIVAAFECS